MESRVSIHTPARGVTAIGLLADLELYGFNPHSRTGSDKRGADARGPPKSFNPHSRTGSDLTVRVIVVNAVTVSIHTPARGVTRLAVFLSVPQYVSIHTPARGVTAWKSSTPFWSRVSIHTPARGVTAVLVRSCVRLCGFNPHSRTGSDGFTIWATHRKLKFQSTLPHGE